MAQATRTQSKLEYAQQGSKTQSNPVKPNQTESNQSGLKNPALIAQTLKKPLHPPLPGRLAGNMLHSAL
jgi:hypothetical protein